MGRKHFVPNGHAKFVDALTVPSVYKRCESKHSQSHADHSSLPYATTHMDAPSLDGIRRAHMSMELAV